MGTNIFSNRVQSPNGLSPFERGLSTDGFNTGDKVKAAGTSKPQRKVFVPEQWGQTDFYPGLEGYLAIVQELQRGVNGSFGSTATILLPCDSVTTGTRPADGMKDFVKGEGAVITTAGYTGIQESIKHNDTVTNFYSLTVDQLVTGLVDRFFDDVQATTGWTNREWCDPGRTLGRSRLATSLKSALEKPNGFPSSLDPARGLINPRGFRDDSWDTWAGVHWGVWMSDYGKTYLDTANWESPVLIDADPEDTSIDSTTGKPRRYDHQHVTWLERPKYDAVEKDSGGTVIRTNHSEHGWNNSHPDVPYIWGWDPKDWNPAKKIKYPGTWGVHLGYPFLFTAPEDIRFILWLTPTEVFLECVNLSRDDSMITLTPKLTAQYTDSKETWVSNTIPSMEPTKRRGHPKTSTSLNGRGQWVIRK